MSNVKAILNSLNDDQKEVVKNIHGKYAVLATAGSGKTHCMVSRVDYMINMGIDARNILMFTFTKKAAEEMKERAIKNIGEDANNLTVSTYHSFCVKILRMFIDKLNLGYNKHFTIYDEGDRESMVNNILKELSKKNDDLKEYKPKEIIRYISYFKDNLMDPSDVDAKFKGIERYQHANIIYKELTKRMRSNNAVDFDDMLFLSVKLIQSYQEVQNILNNKYRYIIADEFQDSSPIDLKFIELLAGRDNEKWNICVVGDIDQSIYSFRGTNVNEILKFIRNNEFTILNMGQNYRSTINIVKGSDSLIVNNTERISKKVFTENEIGPKITFMRPYDVDAEAKSVCKLIKASSKAGWSYNDIAILYRTNVLSRRLEEEFIRNGIPYRIVNGLSFYSRKEVKDILAYVKLLANPKDTESFRRIANVPKRGIGDASVIQIIAHATVNHSNNVIAACKDVPLRTSKARAGAEEFSAIMEQLSEVAQLIEVNIDGNRNLGELLSEIVSITDYRSYLNDTEKDEDVIYNKMENIQELISIAHDYNNIDEFIESIMTYVHEDKEEEDNQPKINLMTIHGSKGLEWPIVIVVGCVENCLPHIISIKENNIEEERRLMYVAMTRAKGQLVLTGVQKMYDRKGAIHEVPRSRFINEINSKYINIIK